MASRNTLASQFATWACVEGEAAVSTQTLSQLTDDAQQVFCNSESSSSKEDPSVAESAPGVKASSPWWALQLALLTRRHFRPPLKRPLNIISGCTGISAESFVCKAGRGGCFSFINFIMLYHGLTSFIFFRTVLRPAIGVLRKQEAYGR